MKRLFIFLLFTSSLLTLASAEGLEEFEQIINTITYDPYHDIKEWNRNEYWQSPDETRLLQRGDCEDLCLLLMDDLNAVGIESFLIVINLPNENIYHTLVRVDEIVYDPSIQQVFPTSALTYMNVYYILTREQAFATMKERK